MSDSVIHFAIKSVDETTREVTGRATKAEIDRSGEILDYHASKPYWEQWRDETLQASGGKSLGNLRVMHRDDIAAGILTRMDFLDDEEAIDVTAKVVDDAEWEKVTSGTYTGFSQRGPYISRTPDYSLPKFRGMTVHRVVIAPREVSLVDRPCVPSATFFEVKKCDGTTENRLFKGGDMDERETPAANDGEAKKGLYEVKGLIQAVQDLKYLHDCIGEGGTIGADLEGQIREIGQLALAYLAEELGEHIGLTVDDALDIDALIGNSEDTEMDTDDDGELIDGAKGDYPRHPFRGNQHSKGRGAGAHHGASRSAHLASVRAHKEGSRSAHRAAGNYHKRAASAHAKAGNTKMVAHHKAQAAYHFGAAGPGGAGKADGDETDAMKAARNGRKAMRAELAGHVAKCNDAMKSYLDTYKDDMGTDDAAQADKADGDPTDAKKSEGSVADEIRAVLRAELEPFMPILEAAKAASAESGEPRPRPSVRAVGKDDEAIKSEAPFDARKAASEATTPESAIKTILTNPGTFRIN